MFTTSLCTVYLASGWSDSGCSWLLTQQVAPHKELGVILRHCKHYIIRLQTSSVELQWMYTFITLYGCVGLLYSSMSRFCSRQCTCRYFRAVFLWSKNLPWLIRTSWSEGVLMDGYLMVCLCTFQPRTQDTSLIRTQPQGLRIRCIATQHRSPRAVVF